MTKKVALFLALIISCPLLGNTEDRRANNQDGAAKAHIGETKNEARFHKMVDEASETYRAIAKGPHGEVPTSVLKNARCIAILPSVLTGAVVIGGTTGEGLASCRDTNNKWSQPAAISLNQGSIGLQAGAKSADLVLFFQSEDAEKALKRGKFALGTDVSAVAGNYDANVDTSKAGVLVYSRAEGVFAGASVTGGKMGNDQDELAGYYGKKVDYMALLEGRETPDSSGYTKKLTELFPSRS